MSKNWGSDVIPKSEWINTEKQYTSGACEVVDLKIVLHNSNDSEVTYPVKGTVILATKPRLKTEYRIWSLDGRADVVWGNQIAINLVEKR